MDSIPIIVFVATLKGFLNDVVWADRSHKPQGLPRCRAVWGYPLFHFGRSDLWDSATFSRSVVTPIKDFEVFLGHLRIENQLAPFIVSDRTVGGALIELAHLGHSIGDTETLFFSNSNLIRNYVEHAPWYHGHMRNKITYFWLLDWKKIAFLGSLNF